MSNIFEIALGLVLAYYVLGLVVSFISKFVMEALETRGTVLEDHLKKLVGKKKFGDLVEMPQIKSLAPVRYNRFWGVFKPNLKGGYFDEAKTKVESIPVANLVDAFFELNNIMGEKIEADKLKEIIDKLPEKTRKSLQPYVTAKIEDVDKLREKVNLWFTGLMDQAAATYKSHARRFVILFSLLVTLITGIDSIELATKLSQDATLREYTNARATAYAELEEQPELETVLEDAEKLSLRVGWLTLPQTYPKKDSLTGRIPSDALASYWLLKVLGLAITTVAVSQGSSFWYDILRKMTTRQSGSDKNKKDEDSEAVG
jgi:hypothetical protein